MPLEHSSSKQAFSRNISELIRSGYPQKQAAAISYDTQRKARAWGGGIRGYDDGGDVTPDVASDYDPAAEAQSAREAAAGRLSRGVAPPEGRAEGPATDAMLNTFIPGRAAVQDISAGNYGKAGLDVGADLLPFSKLVPQPIRRGIASGAMFGAGTLLPVNSDEARAEDLTWMTPQQKSAYSSIRGRDNQDTRVQRSKFVQEQLALAQIRQDKLKEQEAAVARAKEESSINSAAEERKLAAMRADETARQEQERQSRLQAEKDAALESERRSKLPFRERHPEAAMGIQGAMLGLSAAVPFGQSLASSRNWSNVANRAEQAMASGNKPAAKLAVDQLRQYGKPSPAEKAAVLNSPLMPLEGGTVIPNAWDYYSLGNDENNPNWQAARRELNPMESKFWENAGIGLVEGVPLATLGSKAAGLVARPPKEQSAGLIKSFEERKSWPRTPTQSTTPTKLTAEPVAKTVQTRKRATPTKTKSDTPQTRAGGGGVAGGFDDAFSELFNKVPQLQKLMTQGHLSNGISGMMSQVPGMESQNSPSSPAMTGATNGMSRLAPAPVGSGIMPVHNNVVGTSAVSAQNRADGGFSVQKGPHLTAPWQTRAEARGLMHTGPVMSSVPGRTDAHSTHVPSSSYVLPADHVSSMGQGNTMAGMNALNKMFSQGPFGTSVSHLSHGRGIPSGPRLKTAHSGGGKEGSGSVGSPVPVNIAGGEYVITPEALQSVVHPDIDTAHAIMDSWVVQNRKKHVNTLRKLPPPATD